MDKKDKDRYITIKGDKIHQHYAVNILMANDVQATGIALALSAVFYKYMSPELLATNTADIAFDNITDSAIIRFLEPHFFYAGFSEEDLKEKCIDKKPNYSTSKTPSNYMIPIMVSGMTSAITIGATILIDTISITSNITAGNPMAACNIILGDIAAFSRLGSTFNRMCKLQSGEWAIVDTPKKEKVTEPSKINAKPAFSM